MQFHENPLSLGVREHKQSTYRIAGVHHSQETWGKVKMDTKQGKEKEREEEVQLTIQLDTTKTGHCNDL